MALLLFIFAALAALYGHTEAGTPWLITSPNTAMVAENSPMNTVLVNITTADPMNMSVTITGQTPDSTPRQFMIYNNMLVVAMDNNLNFESQSSYTVDINITDPSDLNVTRYTQTINVTVTDVNEAPMVTNDMSSVTIPSSTIPGETITFVTATDPEGNAVTYSIKADSNPGPTFAIDQNGNITVAAGIDLENPEICMFNLVVMANDTGNPALTGSTGVSVGIIECSSGGWRLVSGLTFVLAALIHYIL